MQGGCLEARGARIWIFVGFVLGFAAIIAAVWTMIAYFSEDSKEKFLLFFLIMMKLSMWTWNDSQCDKTWNDSFERFIYHFGWNLIWIFSMNIFFFNFYFCSKWCQQKQLAGYKPSFTKCFHILGFTCIQVWSCGRTLELSI